jgi:hypothetical protein
MRTPVRLLLVVAFLAAACSSAPTNPGDQGDGGAMADGGSSSGSSSGGSGGSSGGSSSGGSSSSSGGSSGSSSGGADAGDMPQPFAALHTYYVSPTGSDNNPGTSAAAAWATPKHAVQCGDVIIAESGNYSSGQFGTNSWGKVTGCPSTSGGIDGKGGVYFASVVCAGPNITSCHVDGGSAEAFRVDESNWAVEGFYGTQANTAQGGCYSATSESTTTLHHIAFINDMAVHCALAGFDSYSWNGPTGGVDQQAVVGTIAFDGAPSTNGSGLCGSGISLIPENGPDKGSGTHVFVAGSFSYKNINAPVGAGCNTDGEGLIFDSWGVSPYSYQAVVEQNVFWANGSAAFEAFPQGNHSTDDQATIVLSNNTSYGNHQDPKNPGGGELLLNQVYPRANVNSYTFTDNIFEATSSSPGNSGNGTVVGAEMDCVNDCPASVLITNGNYIWNDHPPTTTTTGGENTHAWYSGNDQGGNWPWGMNGYSDPGFANPAALPKDAPDCSKYANTTDCMNTGYNVASNMKPSGGAAGKGYQPPGSCKADAYFPTWLKGVVYLSWNGSSLTENPGLITKPCDM